LLTDSQLSSTERAIRGYFFFLGFFFSLRMLVPFAIRSPPRPVAVDQHASFGRLYALAGAGTKRTLVVSAVRAP
jgi:hypothetical protein